MKKYLKKNTDMLNNLCLAANGDIRLAEKGILVIDEFDKLAEKPSDSQSHVSRLGVQRSLLKLLDGTVFYFNNKEFNTSKLTIVCIGALFRIFAGEYSGVCMKKPENEKEKPYILTKAK